MTQRKLKKYENWLKTALTALKSIGGELAHACEHSVVKS